MSDDFHFQAHLDEHPDDQGTRLLLAEWLAERGDWRADGMRWMVAAGKYPLPDVLIATNTRTWDWWSMLPGWNSGQDDNNDRNDRLEPPLMLALDGYHRKSNWSADSAFCEYHTRIEAENALCRAVLKVGPGPSPKRSPPARLGRLRSPRGG